MVRCLEETLFLRMLGDLVFLKGKSIDTNNSDDIIEVAEGLGQESAMHRFFIACLVLALIAQGSGADGQTTSDKCTPKTDYIIPSDIAQNNEVFHVVVIGDSIAWGAGLEKEKKYSFLVAEWLSKQLKRPVNVKILAQTGAVINQGWFAKRFSDKSRHKDLSSKRPSLMEQTESISDPTHVDLILVSGGINDVTVDDIIKLDHLENYKKSWLYNQIPVEYKIQLKILLGIERWVSTCSEKDLRKKTGKIKPIMKDLLDTLLANCPNAIIIVTGYYPIVSEKSTGLTEAINVLMPPSQYILDYQKLDDHPQKEQLITKSNAFYDESTKSLEMSVLETKSKRAAFARIEFKPENSYGAYDSFLWKIESGQTRTDDPLYECRVELVKDGNKPDDERDKVIAVGHPNEKGARQYFLAIKEAIEKTSPEFLPKVEEFSVASPTTSAP